MPFCSECGLILTNFECVKVKRNSENKDTPKEKILCMRCFKAWETSVLPEPEVVVPPNPSSLIDPLTPDVAIKTEPEIKTDPEEVMAVMEKNEKTSRKRAKVSYNENSDDDKRSLGDDEDPKKLNSKTSLGDEEDDTDESQYEEEWLEETDDNGDLPPEQSGQNLSSLDKCDWCMHQLNKLRYRRLPETLPERTAIMFNNAYRRESSPERLCSNCFDRAHKWAVQWSERTYIRTTEVTETTRTAEVTEIRKATDTHNHTQTYHESVRLPGYQKAGKRSKKCFIPSCQNKLERRLIVPKYLRKVLLELYKVYVSQAAVCEEHIKEYYRDWSFLKNENFSEEFTVSDVEGMLDLLRNDILSAPE